MIENSPVSPSRIFRILLPALLAAFQLGAEESVDLSPPAPGTAHSAGFESRRLDLDPSQIRTGTASFRIVAGGRQVGTSVVETSIQDGHLVIHGKTRLGSEGSEDAVLRLDAETFAPRTALLSADAGGVLTHAQYRVDGQSLRGATYRYDLNEGRFEEYPVERELPGGTFFRGSAFALAPAMPLDRGEPLKFNWFAPEQGALALVWLEVAGVETVTVPAGTFETYRVVQKDGMVNMVLSVTTASPRQVVRAFSEGGPYVLERMP